MKKIIVPLVVLVFFAQSCSSTSRFSYNPHFYIERILKSELKISYDAEKLPKPLLKLLKKSSGFSFKFSNPDENYSISQDIYVTDFSYQKLVFYGKSSEGLNIVCYETKGYEKRAIIYESFNKQIKGTFAIIFQNEDVGVSNYQEYMRNTDYKITRIYQ